MAIVSSNQVSYQDGLPGELWDNIFAKTKFWDQVALSRVCKQFRDLVSSPRQLFGQIRIEVVNEERVLLRTVKFKRTIESISQDIWQPAISRRGTPESDATLLLRLEKEVSDYIAATSKSLSTHGQVLFRNQHLILRPSNFEPSQLRLRDFGITPVEGISNLANSIISESVESTRLIQKLYFEKDFKIVNSTSPSVLIAIYLHNIYLELLAKSVHKK